MACMNRGTIRSHDSGHIGSCVHHHPRKRGYAGTWAHKDMLINLVDGYDDDNDADDDDDGDDNDCGCDCIIASVCCYFLTLTIRGHVDVYISDTCTVHIGSSDITRPHVVATSGGF